MKTVNKTDLAVKLAPAPHEAPMVENIIKDVFDAIATELADGNEVSIYQFGTFTPTETSPRKGTALDGTPFVSEGRKRMRFKASKRLIADLNE